MSPLEERMGYKFRNPLLLSEALTHPSLAYEERKPHFDNQRLEFLGDAVLQLVFTHALFTLFPGFTEGMLTKVRSGLVSRDALRIYALRLDLGGEILLGRGELSSGGRERGSTLADAFEALVGAIYMDSDLEAAREFILRIAGEDMQRVAQNPEDRNPKGGLQEILQAYEGHGPRYQVLEESGPDHAKHYSAAVYWRGIELGRGEGPSKKHAEIMAAADALGKQLWIALVGE